MHEKETNKKADDYYNIIAPSYNQLHQEEQEKKIAIILQELKRLKWSLDNHTILDVGCGTGISSQLGRKFNNTTITGMDPAQKLLDQATSLDHKLCCSAEDMPTNKTYNTVISLTALQNCHHPQQAVKNIAAVTKQYAILSILKKSQKLEEIEKLIKEHFKVVKDLEEDKDWIYFCEKK